MNWVDILLAIVVFRTGYIGFARGIGIELVKAAALITALAIGANFHEQLAALAVHLPLPQSIMLVLAYALLVMSVLYLGHLVNQWLMVRWLKREHPKSIVERVLGAFVGIARGAVTVGALLVLLQAPPLGPIAHYVNTSVYDRSATGVPVAERTQTLMERAANCLPGRANRSELFPFAAS